MKNANQKNVLKGILRHIVPPVQKKNEIKTSKVFKASTRWLILLLNAFGRTSTFKIR